MTNQGEHNSGECGISAKMAPTAGSLPRESKPVPIVCDPSRQTRHDKIEANKVEMPESIQGSRVRVNNLVSSFSPILITGAGCSGTGYISEVLTDIGVRCGHERVINPQVALGFTDPDWSSDAADASWLATFDAARYQVPVALQLRNPLSVALSYLNLGFYDLGGDEGHRKYRAVVVAKVPSIFAEPTEVGRVLCHIYESFTRAQPVAAMVYEVEGLGPDTVADLLRLGGRDADFDEMPTVSTTTNTHTRHLDSGPLIESVLASPWWPRIYDIYHERYPDLPR